MRRLECFIAVAEHLNFTVAAKHIYIGQSALSQQIAALEEELGVRLLDRTKHSVRLTAAGKTLFLEAQAITARIDEAVQKVRLAHSGKVGSLKIGFLSSVTRHFLPQVAAAFRNKYPYVDMNLIPLYLANLQDDLMNGNLDLAFTRPLTPSNPNFVYKIVYRDQLAVVMRYDHPLAVNNKIDFSLLKDEPFVTYTKEIAPPLLARINQFCIKGGFTPNIVKVASRAESLLFMIEAGIGITVLNHAFNKAYANPFLKFIDIDSEDDTSNDLVLAWNPNNSNPALALFIDEFDVILPKLSLNIN